LGKSRDFLWKDPNARNTRKRNHFRGLDFRSFEGNWAWPPDGGDYIQTIHLRALLLPNARTLSEGVPQDYVQATAWIRKAAGQGNAEAQASLGAAYGMGKGVQQDYTQAVAWYRKAAEQGFARAQEPLGGFYATGKGVPQDNAEAAKWYRKAAQQGNAAAQLNLGALYLTGEGVPRDNSEGYFWLRVAAARDTPGKGSEQIESLLGLAASHLTTAALSQAQQRAREWLAAQPTAQH
jgi:TPR repeat protein